MDSRLAELVANPALTPDALRLILYVASLGEGEHEIPTDTIQMLLRCGGERPIYRAREVAERHGLVWRRGGRGHHNVYGWSGLGADSLDNSAQKPTQVILDPAPELTQVGYVGVEADSSPPVVVGSSKEAVAVASAHAREGFGVSEKATEVMAQHNGSFTGFRGTLRDYLQARVPPDRQHWYVQTLAAWIAGTDQSVFRLQNGDRVPASEIPGMIAAGLNELLATGEKDAKPKPMKYADGDVRNLKTKLSVLCQQRGDHRRSAPQPSNGSATPMSEGQHTIWLRLREEAERRGMDPETAARETLEEARRAS